MKTKMAFVFFAAIVVFSSCQLKQPATTNENAGTVAAVQAHNAQNALDWQGVYKGILPCADCEGIETSITLNADMSYQKTTLYIGKEAVISPTEGTFSWNETGTIIHLDNESSEPASFFVGENSLTHLDMQGNKITGQLADMYVLKKVLVIKDPQLTNVKWQLTELMGKAFAAQEGKNRQAFIIFSEEGAKMHGNGSCNTFNGSYELKEGNRITLTGFATTMMACADMETERQLFDILSKCDNYTIADGVLSLNKARMAPLARFSASKD